MKDFLDRVGIEVRAGQDVNDVLSFEPFTQFDGSRRRRRARAFD